MKQGSCTLIIVLLSTSIVVGIDPVYSIQDGNASLTMTPDNIYHHYNNYQIIDNHSLFVDYYVGKNTSVSDILPYNSTHLFFSANVDNSLYYIHLETTSINQLLLPEYITPKILTRDDDGLIWFSDNTVKQPEIEDHIVRYDPWKNNLTYFPMNQLASKPFDIVIQGNNVWFSEWTGKQIGHIDRVSLEMSHYPIPCSTPYCGPVGLDIDGEGKIWFVDNIESTIGRLDPLTGNIKTFPLPKGSESPTKVAIDHEGLIWTGLHAGDQIISFDSKNQEFKTYYGVKPLLTNRISGITDVDTDENGDIWFTEHLMDVLGYHHKDSATMIEYKIPRPSLVQWMTIDDDRVWYGDAFQGIIGSINRSEAPVITISVPSQSVEIQQLGKLSVAVDICYIEGKLDRLNLMTYGQTNAFDSVRPFSFATTDLTLGKGETKSIEIGINAIFNPEADEYNVVLGVENDLLYATISLRIQVSGTVIMGIGVGVIAVIAMITVLLVVYRKRRGL